VLACLQAGPEYLEAEYAAGGRARTITDAEWESALRATAAGGAAGALVYSWRDLLADEARGGRRVPTLLAYRRGDLG
jgi:formylglycine-generating enzyme required for sulfatase activity